MVCIRGGCFQFPSIVYLRAHRHGQLVYLNVAKSSSHNRHTTESQQTRLVVLLGGTRERAELASVEIIVYSFIKFHIFPIQCEQSSCGSSTSIGTSYSKEPIVILKVYNITTINIIKNFKYTLSIYKIHYFYKRSSVTCRHMYFFQYLLLP